MQKRFFAIVIGLILVFSINITPAASRDNALEKVKIAHFGISWQRDIFVGKELGFFEKEGIDCELIKMGAPNVLPAIDSGNVDGGPYPMAGALLAINKGVKIKLVVSGAHYPSRDLLPHIGVLTDSKIQSIQDLNGKIMAGHFKGGTLWLAAQVALKENGVKLKQYSANKASLFIPLLLEKKVDASVVFPESQIFYPGKIRFIHPLDGFRGMQGGADYWFSEKFLKEKPQLVRKWVKGLVNARLYIRNNELKAEEIHQKYAGRPLEELQRVAKSGVLPVYSDEALLEVWKLDYTRNVLLDLGMLKKQMDIMQVVDTRFSKTLMKDGQ